MKNRAISIILGLVAFLPWLLLLGFIWSTFQLESDGHHIGAGAAAVGITAHKLAMTLVMLSLLACLFHVFLKRSAPFGRKPLWAFALES